MAVDVLFSNPTIARPSELSVWTRTTSTRDNTVYDLVAIEDLNGEGMPTEVLIDYTSTPWLIEAAKSSWTCTNPSPPVRGQFQQEIARLLDTNAIIRGCSYS